MKRIYARSIIILALFALTGASYFVGYTIACTRQSQRTDWIMLELFHRESEKKARDAMRHLDLISTGKIGELEKELWGRIDALIASDQLMQEECGDKININKGLLERCIEYKKENHPGESRSDSGGWPR